MNAFENGYKDKTKIEKKTVLERYKFIDKSMSEWGEGAIAVVNVPGHTFLGIRVDGETRYFDPQVKKEYSEFTLLGDLLDRPLKKGTYEILRVDNRNFTDIAYACMEGR